MPALSPTMSQGNVSSWQVKEGDEIAAGDVLAEIETDKATLEWENQDDGFVAKILVEAGTKDVAVGTPLAVVVDDEARVGDFANYTPEGSGEAAAPEDGASEEASSSGRESAEPQPDSGGPETQPRDKLRRIGPAALRLLRESGIAEADVRPRGPFGIVTKGDVLAAMSGKRKPGTKDGETKSQPSKPSTEKEQAAPKKPADSPPKEDSSERRLPSGPAPGEHTDVPNSQIRKIIAQRLLESKQTVPHFYVRATADLDAVTQLRQSMKAQGTKVSVNDFVIRAVALALAEVPRANAAWDGAAEDAKPQESVDVAIAVATDKGLITPIVRAANTKSLKQVSQEVRELAGRARANKLKPDEFQGGTFTISNLGMFGVDHFCAIINPPQAGILAIGGTQETLHLEGGRPAARQTMKMTLSADQRVFDGETTAKFLEAVAANLSNPVKLLV